MKSVAELVVADRSVRRFAQEPPVTEGFLRELVDLARVAHSGGNAQPLRYALVTGAEACAALFPYTRWAAALPGWAGPAEGERPTGYVVICRDLVVSHPGGVDHGIAAEVMTLAAVEAGFAACMIGAFDPKGVAAAAGVDPERHEPLLVVAIGTPGETVVLEAVGEDGSTKYWRDAEGVHHVPKRSLEHVIIAVADGAPRQEEGV